jgi:hypothetical protein
MGCERVPDAGALASGCVACIFTVAFGKAGALLFGVSLGRVMRAVSFFGEAGFAITPEGGAGAAGIAAAGAGAGAGLSGTVGFAASGGGFGGGVPAVSGLVTGIPSGTGGGGGVPPAAGGNEIFDVSFFGVWLNG